MSDALYSASQIIDKAAHDPKLLEAAEAAAHELLCAVKKLIAERDALHCPKCKAVMARRGFVSFEGRESIRHTCSDSGCGATVLE